MARTLFVHRDDDVLPCVKKTNDSAAADGCMDAP
jgi:hypothetical protein